MRGSVAALMVAALGAAACTENNVVSPNTCASLAPAVYTATAFMATDLTAVPPSFDLLGAQPGPGGGSFTLTINADGSFSSTYQFDGQAAFAPQTGTYTVTANTLTLDAAGASLWNGGPATPIDFNCVVTGTTLDLFNPTTLPQAAVAFAGPPNIPAMAAARFDLTLVR